MCGFAGILNKNVDLTNEKKKIRNMTKVLKYRGPDESGYFIGKNILLGHQRLSIIDLKNGKQPMSHENYTIVYNGELYNTDKIRQDLISKNYTFHTTSDTEVLLKGYIEYSEKILDMIEGIYAFCVYDGKSLFMARDPFGVKPLFYTKVNNYLLFASEIKALFKSNLVQPIINKRSLQELLALGPSKTPGSGIFKDIHELRPAHYLIYQNNKISISRYWNIKNEACQDTFDESVEKVRALLTNSIQNQMVSDVPISTLLSGGLDSSIITAVCSEALKKEGKQLSTFSIDYEDNEKYFKPNSFQISGDRNFIELMKEKFDTKHSYKVISQRKLAKTLKESVIARDYPGMADIDSSLYWFAKQVKKKFKVVLSGECADEIFGGYPWFYNEEVRNREFFPWIDSLNERNELLNPTMREILDLKGFVKERYEESISEVPTVNDLEEQSFKNLFYLNMIWFMPTLLERKDRMTMRASLEARVPFADRKLIEYLWNLPWDYKFHEGKEKGLLRKAFEDLLPEEITNRKKNPYPKTHHPKYANLVSKMLKKRLKNKNSILYTIFDPQKLQELLDTKGSSFKTPWFGQLMTGPELIAYLYQFDVWAEYYHVVLDF